VQILTAFASLVSPEHWNLVSAVASKKWTVVLLERTQPTTQTSGAQTGKKFNTMGLLHPPHPPNTFHPLSALIFRNTPPKTVQTVRSPKYAPPRPNHPSPARASLCSCICLCLCLPITNAWARLEALELLGGRENVIREKTRWT